MSVGDVDQVGRKLVTVHELEGDNLAKSCEDPPESHLRILTIPDVFREARDIEIVLTICHTSQLLLSCQCHRLLAHWLADRLLVGRLDLELHVANGDAVEHAGILSTLVAGESDLGPGPYRWPACTFLQAPAWDERAAENWHVHEDRAKRLDRVVLREVNHSHRLVTLDETASVAKSTHLEKLARIRRLHTCQVLLGLFDGKLARLFLHEPDIAVALALQGLRIRRYLSRLHSPKLFKHQVQVFSGDGLIEACDA